MFYTPTFVYLWDSPSPNYFPLLGPVAVIMVGDYFFIRDIELDIHSLYHRDDAYYYDKGVNPRASPL